MTDLELLTGTIAARLRALPEIDRLYPSRRSAFPVVGSALGVITALASDDTVVTRIRDETTEVEVDLAVSGTASAPAAARAAADAVQTVLDSASLPRRQVTIRIASVEL